MDLLETRRSRHKKHVVENLARSFLSFVHTLRLKRSSESFKSSKGSKL